MTTDIEQQKAKIVKKAVDRFLSWKLPDDFYPDAGISFEKPENPEWHPVGTNLFHAEQAKAMFEFALGDALTEALALKQKEIATLEAMDDFENWFESQGQTIGKVMSRRAWQHVTALKQKEIDDLKSTAKKLEFYLCHTPNCATSKAAKKHELADCTCGLDQAIANKE